ncbi:MAG: phosphatase PAP2 family protein [Bacillota bacterium]|nr:phosphatase PAP2 family protein [Bacillota bacterium]
MDLNYLFFLQQLREAAPTWLNAFLLFFSELMGSSLALGLLALIYWCISKKDGSFLLLNFSGAYLFNQGLKNIFRVDRPFLRDARLQPYTAASGYSFPSGHTMLSTSVYVGLAARLRQKKALLILCILLTLLTAFGRNWLGVHTPQDVLVGIAASCLVVALNSFLLNWVESHEKWDWLLCLLGLALAGLILLFCPGSGKVVGIYSGTLLGWLLERRCIRFEIRGGFLYRALLFAGGMALLLLLHKLLLPALFVSLEPQLSAGLSHFLIFLLIMAGWPALMMLFHKLFRKSSPRA